MTREEMITNLEKLAALFHTESEQSKMVDYSKIIETLEFAAAALRPITREQVEMARGGWRKDSEYMPIYVCSKCGERNLFRNGNNVLSNFCPHCGAPMTDKAEDIVMERLEALRDE